MDAQAAKTALRKSAQVRRRDLAADRKRASAQMAGHLLALLSSLPDADGTHPVGAYVALEDEIDPAPALARLDRAGVPLALPAVERRGAPLVFRAWRPGDPCRTSSFGVAEPLSAAPEVCPRILLVPLLAFDKDGFRLGFGGGYYDRTIASLRQAGPLCAVGLAFAGQRIDRVPREAHDMPLDWIVTEEGSLRLARQRERT